VNSVIFDPRVAHYSLYLHHHNSESVESWTAVRYIGRILEYRTFWAQPSHNNHRVVIKKLVRRVTQLVKDLDLECPISTDHASRMALRADIRGIDTISSALLEGARILDDEAEFRSDPLCSDFEQFVMLLRQ
jgi:hypothetical protein